MAVVDLDALSVDFPDNRIVLINGSELVCYPKAVQPKTNCEDNLSIDTSGEYLTVGSKLKAKKETTDKDELKDFFYKNAFLFFRNAHRILTDSRMFLAPVPVQNGLAYTGTSGFRNPTLGVYIEWWLNCDPVTKDEKGRVALTCHIAGSPLSGSNRCTCVYPDGKIRGIFHDSFSNVWSTFVKINKRYAKAKQMYEAYTLPEVVDLLLAAGQSRESELDTLLDIAEGHANILKRRYYILEKQYNDLQKRFNELGILHYKEELDALRAEYRTRQHNAEMEIESLATAMAEFKSQMKQGIINNVEYQHAITPLRKRNNEIQYEMTAFRTEKISALVKKGYITYSQIDNYIIQDDK